MANRIEVCVFGPTRALVDGDPVDLGSRLQRSVLAAFVAAPGHGASSDALIEAIWGEHAPPSARKSVQKYVSQLRARLGQDVIETTATGYRINRDVVAVDIDRFDALVEGAENLLGDEGAREALAMCDAALEVASAGEPLEDIAGAGFPLPIVARLGERVAVARERRIEAMLSLGRDPDAVAAAEELLTTAPLREVPWSQLMIGLYRSGRQSEALRAYRRLQRVLGEELGIDPSDELRDLEQRILLHDPSLSRESAVPVNLPAAFTSFVGRERELAELSTLLDGSRLVTVTGPGGSGKTRLAVEAAANRVPGDRREAWFVDLAHVDDASQVATAVTGALGIARDPAVPALEALTAHLASRKALLVIDNCEHILGEAAAVIYTVLRTAGDVVVLATSREPLGLTGEVVYVLQPLAVPPEEVDDSDRALTYGAVRLFTDRAEAALPGFVLGDALDDVITICIRLDGIPLAIELAARQLSLLDLADIRRGLLDRLDRLAAPGEPVARHRTLEAAIDWSYRLAAEDTRRFFVALSVFPGTFTREAAATVWTHLEGPGSADEHLAALVAGSVVLRIPAEPVSRYRLLEPIRAFAAARADERFRGDQLGRAHALWVLELLSEDTVIIGVDERETLRRLTTEDHQYSVALAWATEHDPEIALRLTIASTSYLWMVSYRFAWSDELRAAIDAGRSAPEELRAAALAHAGHSLAENFADYETAKAYAEEALVFAKANNDSALEVSALLTMANALRNGGRLDESAQYHMRSIRLADEIGADLWGLRSRRWLAFTEMQRGNYDEALELIGIAKDMGEKLGSDWVAGKSLWLAAAILALNGDYEAAEENAARAFELFEGYEDPASPVHVRAVQGDAARLSGDALRAAAIYEECLRGFQDVGDRRCTASTLRNLGLVNIQLERPNVAGQHLVAALRRRHAFGDDAGVAECLEGLAQVSRQRGATEDAITFCSAAETLRSRSGSRPPHPERLAIAATLEAARESAGRQASQRAWDAGPSLVVDPEIVARVERRLAFG